MAKTKAECGRLGGMAGAGVPKDMSARAKKAKALAGWATRRAKRKRTEERRLAYRGRMFARLATYIRQHPELPAVQHPVKDSNFHD